MSARAEMSAPRSAPAAGAAAAVRNRRRDHRDTVPGCDGQPIELSVRSIGRGDHPQAVAGRLVALVDVARDDVIALVVDVDSPGAPR